MIQTDQRPTLISASLFDQAAESVRGQIDKFDPVTGIEGWAVDLADTDTALIVELLIGDAVVAQTTAERSRPDIAEALNLNVMAGFAFPDDISDRIVEIAASGTRGILRIRIAGTAYLLPSLTPPPDLHLLLSGMSGLKTDGYRGFDMMARLSALRTETTDLLRQPLRPLPENSLGFIESIAIDEAGLVWIGGWMKRAVQADQPVVIVDRQKISGAMGLTMFERADLGDEAYGIIGVLHSDWRPSPQSELFVYMGDGTSYLQSLRPLNIVTKKSFTEHFAHRWPTCHTGHSSTLHYLLDHPDSWQPTDGASGPQVKASLEKVLVLPSFGCLVTGWALSPLKAIENFGLKFGSTILSCDTSSISFWPRPDLASLVPGCDLLTDRAGFVAIFRGAIPPRDLDNPIIKVLLSDGSASNHSVDMKVVQRLGRATSIDKVLHLYPSLRSESFFREFAAAVRQDARELAEAADPFKISACTRAMVLGVPAERSDAFLLFENIGHRVRGRRHGPGLVFIAGRGATRHTVIGLFQELAASTELPCSLFFVDDPAGSSYALPGILNQVGADRFAFAAPGVLLTDEGWAAATARDEGLTLITIEDAASHAQGDGLSLDCFAWNSAKLAEWLRIAPSFLGGLGSHAARLLRDDAARIIPDGAWYFRIPAGSLLTRAINDIAMVA